MRSVYFFLEIVAIALYIARFGFGNFLAEVFISAIFGIFVIIKFGMLNLGKNFRKFSKNPINTFEISFGGFLLIMPGILTDLIGVLIIVFSMIFGEKKTQEMSDEEFFYSGFNTFDDKEDRKKRFNQRFDYFDGYKKEDKKQDKKEEIIDVEVIE